MAPIDQLKYTSNTRKPSTFPVVEDDDKWTDLVSEKEGKDSPVQTEPIAPATTITPTPEPVEGKFPPPMNISGFPCNYGMPDSLGRSTPTQQMSLEAQLIHLGEIELGLMNAVEILEKHLINTKKYNITHEPFELMVPNTYPITSTSYSRITASPSTRSILYSNERQTAASALRDMAYLLGLRRAVNILKEALADENRKDATYTVKGSSHAVPPMPMPVPPSPFPPPPPMYVTPPGIMNQNTQLLQEKEFRNIAKDIVKESVREYKDSVVGPSIEEVQQEMIKLCRDVCRDALNRRD